MPLENLTLTNGPIPIYFTTGYPGKKRKRLFALRRDAWDDFTYKTTFHLSLWDDDGKEHTIGILKIGKAGLKSGRTPIDVGNIEQLPEEYFSLGASAEYYENLQSIPASNREALLRTLRDMAFSTEIWNRYRTERVTEDSLLRDTSPRTVEEQLRRMANGLTARTYYSFQYTPPAGNYDSEPPCLKFEIDPEAPIPPNNIHAIIGRNGAGKSFLLQNMFNCLKTLNYAIQDCGFFTYGSEGAFTGKPSTDFVKVIAVSYSAFDDFKPLPAKNLDQEFVVIGLYNQSVDGKSKAESKSIEDQFADSAESCISPAKSKLWKAAIKTLESDQNFKDYGLQNLADLGTARDGDVSMNAQEYFREYSKEVFSTLSSGHKIVLLAITGLIQHVAEKTLVLIDEPETHLHPPLLASFIRAVSELLDKQNGVAIVATHSPVVLQEVPRKCTWMLNRIGKELQAKRPKVETFGENISVLTDEIFRLELEDSGYHKVLKEVAAKHATYEEAVEVIKDQLGSEAKAILRGLYSNQKDEEAN